MNELAYGQMGRYTSSPLNTGPHAYAIHDYVCLKEIALGQIGYYTHKHPVTRAMLYKSRPKY